MVRPLIPTHLVARDSVGEREVVRAHVCGSGISAEPTLDRLVTTEAAVTRAKFPAEIRQRLVRLRGNASLEPQQPHALLGFAVGSEEPL